MASDSLTSGPVLGPTLILAALTVLAGCEPPAGEEGGSHGTAVEAGVPEARYENLEYGIAVSYPKEVADRDDGKGGYFNEEGWRVGAGPDEPGEALLVLRLKGSDDIRAGELHLGASQSPEAVAACTEPDDWARSSSVGEATLDGVAFTTFEGGDAAMNHYRRVHAWRAVRGEVCYAIDLVVQGTHGEVYDPPREAPFGEARAFSDLNDLLDGVRFMDGTRVQ